jgi:hypothetical protein
MYPQKGRSSLGRSVKFFVNSARRIRAQPFNYSRVFQYRPLFLWSWYRFVINEANRHRSPFWQTCCRIKHDNSIANMSMNRHFRDSFIPRSSAL